MRDKKFDFIITRAIIEWCDDPEDFLLNLSFSLKSGGIIIIDTLIIPTIGTVFWSQWSEYAYKKLYSPEFLEDIFTRLNLKIVRKIRKANETMDVFWADRYPIESKIKSYYEWKALRKLRFDADEFRRLEFNSRDSRAYRYVLQRD